MEHKNEKLHQGVLSFIEANPKPFKELQVAYNKTEQMLRGKIDKLIPEITINDLEGLDDIKDQELIIELGNHIASLQKASKRKFISEYIMVHLKLDLALCRLSVHAFDFFYIKNQMSNTSHFEELLAGYQNQALSEKEMTQLHSIINNWQMNFNNHHLMRFDTMLFGIRYKELKAIKEDCYQKTYATYATMTISKEGTTVLKRDGTQIENWN